MSDSIHNIMNEWLDHHGIAEKEDEYELAAVHKKTREKAGLKKLPSQRSLDLHGLTVKEALTSLEQFITRCRKERIRKILIIHGKGLHSENGPVLKEEILKYLRSNSSIGEIGTPGRAEGGSGASWAIIRQRSR